jgi:hypothetical protein
VAFTPWPDSPATAAVDNDDLAVVLDSVVDDRGLVAYDRLTNNPIRERLDAWVQRLRTVEPTQLGRDGAFALYLNAYNACTLALMEERWPVRSIKAIPTQERWLDARWNIGGELLSLDAIEHRLLRPRFGDPRLHFAINCASISCPPLARTPFQADTLDADLDRVCRLALADRRWCSFDTTTGILRLSPLFLWFSSDFGGVSGVLNFVRSYRPDLQTQRIRRVVYMEWDWSVNDTPTTVDTTP